MTVQGEIVGWKNLQFVEEFCTVPSRPSLLIKTVLSRPRYIINFVQSLLRYIINSVLSWPRYIIIFLLYVVLLLMQGI